MRIFLANDYFGAGNAGDDLTLHGFLAAAARHPDVQLTVCTAHDLAGRQRCFPRIQWLPEDEAVRNDALRNADVWLGLGDTPFQLDSGAWLLDRNERERRRCAALGKPMYLLGVGCESAESAADLRSQALLESVAHVWVRDEFSAGALRPFIDAARLTTGADLAHLAFGDRTPPPPREAGVVGLLLAFERSEQFDLREIERFIEGRASGLTRWLVQEVRTFPHVEQWLLGRLAPEVRARLSIMEFAYATSSVGDYLRAFGAPEVTVTSRYHAALVAAWHGSKVLVVTRSAKVRGLADELDLAHVDRADSRAALEAGVERAAAVPRERLQDARRRASSICDAFFEECRAPKTVIATVNTGARARLTPISKPLPLESLQASIDAEIPSSLSAGETVIVRCTVTNLGDAMYVSAPPNPVELCYRWYDDTGVPYGAGTWIHTALPQPLAPGETVNTAMRIGAPPLPGRYQLAVSLLQESVAWFDDIDAASGVRGDVTVEAGVIAPNLPETFFLLSPAERRERTLQAIEAHVPLLDRWGRVNESWHSEWGFRAACAAEWLSAARSVADLGCGAMTLEQYLLPSQRYIPVDLVARDDRTIVLDLDRDDLSPAAADACALLGVLAYLFDVSALLENVRAVFTTAVVSYSVCRAASEIDARLELGWVNHLSYDALLALFRNAGFVVVKERHIDEAQFLFELAAAH